MVDEHPECICEEILEDDGTFPNNQKLPVLIYPSAISGTDNSLPDSMERIFQQNGWSGSWRNGIYSYHHYHSTAHEVLGIYRGSVTAQLGGPEGITVDASRGDVLILPAGTAHKNLKSSEDFRCIGAYPDGQNWDMNYGREEERPGADRNIESVPLHGQDPVFGRDGPLMERWDIR